jgi:hypothetical protein
MAAVIMTGPPPSYVNRGKDGSCVNVCGEEENALSAPYCCILYDGISFPEEILGYFQFYKNLAIMAHKF